VKLLLDENLSPRLIDQLSDLYPGSAHVHQCGYGKQPPQSGNSMKNTPLKKKPVSAESIARMADNGKDVSRFFTNSGEMRKPIQRVNVDFTASMLEELESAARDLNISRQAVIKTLIRQGLDLRQRARASRTRAKRS
jgi:hypothetical protein